MKTPLTQPLALAALLVAVATTTSAETTPSTASYHAPAAIANTAPGATARVENIPREVLANLPKLAWNREVLPGPQYLISDDPEYIRVSEGVALSETVKPGAVRLYVYNVNGVKEPSMMPRRISAVIENLGDAPLHATFRASVLPKPSGNYHGIAKKALAGFLRGEGAGRTLTVEPKGAAPLDPAMEALVVKYDDLVHGFYEFDIDQPARIRVVQTAPDVASVDASRRLPDVLPTKSKSGAGRGQFPDNMFRITLQDNAVVDTAAGPVQLIIADGKDEPWTEGTESTLPPGEKAVLKGNYGTFYEVQVKRRSSDGRAMALVTWNARAGNSQWCGGMVAAMRVGSGQFPAGVVELPSDGVATKDWPDVVVAQIYPPLPPGQEETITVTYSPPGASCLPTPLIFLPIGEPLTTTP